MFEVSVSGWFSAAHRLRLGDGTLEPLHGHNWRVTVTCRGARVGPEGLLVDFVTLKAALEAELRGLHDRCLNDLEAFAGVNPSAENVAAHFARRLEPGVGAGAALSCVEVEEAPGCCARFYPGER